MLNKLLLLLLPKCKHLVTKGIFCHYPCLKLPVEVGRLITNQQNIYRVTPVHYLQKAIFTIFAEI